MSEDMVERVAKALWDRHKGGRHRYIAFGNTDLAWEDAPEYAKGLRRLMARTTIEELSIPTDAMTDAVSGEGLCHPEDCKTIWQSMINAALNTKGHRGP